VTTRLAFILLLLLTACARPKNLKLPQSVQDWKLQDSSGRHAVYSGVGVVRITIEEMPSSASAFERVQQWRPEERRMAIYKDRFFLVADASGISSETLSRFMAALAERLALE
jgi:hypothetical protein